MGGLFLATSCTGNYNCDCKAGGVATPHFQYTNVKKVGAQEGCDAWESNLKIVDPSASCTLNKL